MFNGVDAGDERAEWGADVWRADMVEVFHATANSASGCIKSRGIELTRYETRKTAGPSLKVMDAAVVCRKAGSGPIATCTETLK
jgi:hypothetical protein